MKILLIDNYDSFTFNLYHYLSSLSAKVDVVRNDEITEKEIIKSYLLFQLLLPLLIIFIIRYLIKQFIGRKKILLFLPIQEWMSSEIHIIVAKVLGYLITNPIRQFKFFPF